MGQNEYMKEKKSRGRRLRRAQTGRKRLLPSDLGELTRPPRAIYCPNLALHTHSGARQPALEDVYQGRPSGVADDSITITLQRAVRTCEPRKNEVLYRILGRTHSGACHVQVSRPSPASAGARGGHSIYMFTHLYLQCVSDMYNTRHFGTMWACR